MSQHPQLPVMGYEYAQQQMPAMDMVGQQPIGFKYHQPQPLHQQQLHPFVYQQQQSPQQHQHKHQQQYLQEQQQLQQSSSYSITPPMFVHNPRQDVSDPFCSIYPYKFMMQQPQPSPKLQQQQLCPADVTNMKLPPLLPPHLPPAADLPIHPAKRRLQSPDEQNVKSESRLPALLNFSFAHGLIVQLVHALIAQQEKDRSPHFIKCRAKDANECIRKVAESIFDAILPECWPEVKAMIVEANSCGDGTVRRGTHFQQPSDCIWMKAKIKLGVPPDRHPMNKNDLQRTNMSGRIHGISFQNACLLFILVRHEPCLGVRFGTRDEDGSLWKNDYCPSPPLQLYNGVWVFCCNPYHYDTPATRRKKLDEERRLKIAPAVSEDLRHFLSVIGADFVKNKIREEPSSCKNNLAPTYISPQIMSTAGSSNQIYKYFDGTKTKAKISEDGLTAIGDVEDKTQFLSALGAFRMEMQSLRNDKLKLSTHLPSQNDASTSTSILADNSSVEWVKWKLGNPPGTCLDRTKTKVKISEDELTAISNIEDKMQWVFATEGFDISGNSRIEDTFPDTVIYYFEVCQVAKSKWLFIIGLSDGSIPANDAHYFAKSQNLYIFPQGVPFCILAGQIHDFEWPTEAIKPVWKWDIGDTIGCGLLLDPENNVFIFFTANGILMGLCSVSTANNASSTMRKVTGKPIPINNPHILLVPTIHMRDMTVEVNFGEDPAKPFKFDINKCPGFAIMNFNNCNPISLNLQQLQQQQQIDSQLPGTSSSHLTLIPPVQQQILWDVNNCNSLAFAQYLKSHPHEQHPSQRLQDINDYNSVPISPQQQQQQRQQRQSSPQQPGTLSSHSALMPLNCQVCNKVLLPWKNGIEVRKCYNSYVCNSYQQFFKRSKDIWRIYECKNGLENCPIEMENRSCQLCRFHKCLAVGMKWPESKPKNKENCDERCSVCGQKGSKLGYHYGTPLSCEGCKAFFRRESKKIECEPCGKCMKNGDMCESCIRFRNCLNHGMDLKKSNRGRPRNCANPYHVDTPETRKKKALEGQRATVAVSVPAVVPSNIEHRKQSLVNVERNGWNWNGSSRLVIISPDGLTVNTTEKWQNVFALNGFPISGEHYYGNDDMLGNILFYFEVTQSSACGFLGTGWYYMGLSSGCIPTGKLFGVATNSYSFAAKSAAANDSDDPDIGRDFCAISGGRHDFEWPPGAIRPRWKGNEDVLGCGISLNLKNTLGIFFTLNGILMGTQAIPIRPSVDRLYPTLTVSNVSLEANFGDNPAKPFQYDINKCPGFDFE